MVRLFDIKGFQIFFIGYERRSLPGNRFRYLDGVERVDFQTVLKIIV